MTAPENDFPRTPLFNSDELARDFSSITELAIRLRGIADEIEAQNKKDRRTIQSHRYGISFDDTVRLDELPATEPLPDVGIYVTKRATGDYYVSVVHDTDAPMGLVSFVHPILVNHATGRGHTNSQAEYGLMDPVSFRRHYVKYDPKAEVQAEPPLPEAPPAVAEIREYPLPLPGVYHVHGKHYVSVQASGVDDGHVYFVKMIRTAEGHRPEVDGYPVCRVHVNEFVRTYGQLICVDRSVAEFTDFTKIDPIYLYPEPGVYESQETEDGRRGHRIEVRAQLPEDIERGLVHVTYRDRMDEYVKPEFLKDRPVFTGKISIHMFNSFFKKV